MKTMIMILLALSCWSFIQAADIPPLSEEELARWQKEIDTETAKTPSLTIENSSGQEVKVKVFRPKGHLTGVLISGPTPIRDGRHIVVKVHEKGAYDVIVDYQDGSHRKIDTYVTGQKRSVIIAEPRSEDKEYYRALKEAVESVESED